MPGSSRVDRLPTDDLAADDERTQQRAVARTAIVRVVARRCRAGGSRQPDQLANCDPPLISRSRSRLASTAVDLAHGSFDDGDELPSLIRGRSGDKLVHQADGGSTAPGHQRRTDAIGIDRSGSKRGDLILVQVTRYYDSGIDRTELVEQRADLVGLH